MVKYRLSVGVLAHNEADRLGATLNSLFSQDIFYRYAVEVIIVSNGCTDETVSVARRSLAEYRDTWSSLGSASVAEVSIAGKANAWNTFVHDLSSKQSPILFLMDADIQIVDTNTLSSMLLTLENTFEAVVCVDRPVKDIRKVENPSLFQRLLVAATPELKSGENVGLCGQLYCAHSAVLRTIMLPTAIAGEDGFLRALLLTEGFTRSENPRRIVLDETASHCFTSVQTIRELFKHEKWLVSSSIVNMILFERFWKEARVDFNAMKLMDAWANKDADWLPKYIDGQVKERGWSLLPRQWWLRRWLHLKNVSFWKKMRVLPVILLATIADIIIFIAAILDVRRGRSFKYWGRI